MRIGIDVRSLLDDQPSGVGEYTRNLLESLFKLDDQNEYFLFANCFNQQKKISLDFGKAKVKLKFFHYPNKLFNLAVNFFRWPKIDKLIGGVDVFLVPNLQFVSLSGDCRKIITVHDLSFEIFPQFLSRRRKLWHKIIRPKKLIASADKVIAVSENTKQDLVDLYKIPENKIKVIYSGVKQKSNFQGNKGKYILSLATFEPRKNIDSLILAFEKLIKKEKFKDYRLVLAGAKGWKTERLKKLVKRDLRIKVLGYVSSEEKEKLLREAEIFVYPSFYEGFGFPPLEAMAAGAPVLCSSAGSLPEVLEEASFYVNPLNVYDILKGLEDLLESDNLRQELVIRGLKQVKKYNWDKTAKEVLNLCALE